MILGFLHHIVTIHRKRNMSTIIEITDTHIDEILKVVKKTLKISDSDKKLLRKALAKKLDVKALSLKLKGVRAKREINVYQKFTAYVKKHPAFKIIPVNLKKGDKTISKFDFRVIGALWQLVDEDFKSYLKTHDTPPKSYEIPVNFLKFYKDNYFSLLKKAPKAEKPEDVSKTISAYIITKWNESPKAEDSDSDSEEEAPKKKEQKPNAKKEKSRPKTPEPKFEPEDSDSGSDSDHTEKGGSDDEKEDSDTEE